MYYDMVISLNHVDYRFESLNPDEQELLFQMSCRPFSLLQKHLNYLRDLKMRASRMSFPETQLFQFELLNSSGCDSLRSVFRNLTPQLRKKADILFLIQEQIEEISQQLKTVAIDGELSDEEELFLITLRKDPFSNLRLEKLSSLIEGRELGIQKNISNQNQFWWNPLAQNMQSADPHENRNFLSLNTNEGSSQFRAAEPRMKRQKLDLNGFLGSPEQIVENIVELDSSIQQKKIDTKVLYVMNRYFRGHEDAMFTKITRKLKNRQLLMNSQECKIFNRALQIANEEIGPTGETHITMALMFLTLLKNSEHFDIDEGSKSLHDALIQEGPVTLSVPQKIQAIHLTKVFKKKLWNTMTDPEKVLLISRHFKEEVKIEDSFLEKLEACALNLQEKFFVMMIIESQHYISSRQWVLSVLKAASDKGRLAFPEDYDLERALGASSPEPVTYHMKELQRIVEFEQVTRFQSEDKMREMLQLVSALTIGLSKFQKLILLSQMRQNEESDLILKARRVQQSPSTNLERLVGEMRHIISDVIIRIKLTTIPSEAVLVQSSVKILEREYTLKNWYENESNRILLSEENSLSLFWNKMGRV
ncbi:hypothetical protein CROQUDRAFT_93448 [Cronartium quercuum f. sp. fusiforme G11]|uniref:Uncharacterized protein n=1 Tax=Cronartium quercuum f. sp. fusiforme G11 TaxID=708437 RepID=A0A9P6NGV0_9BASI|nr:hypothetical protein CROQUDRAFT_93448 [Cronartium quercuum f. sp. fusiforme G11]